MSASVRMRARDRSGAGPAAEAASIEAKGTDAKATGARPVMRPTLVKSQPAPIAIPDPGASANARQQAPAREPIANFIDLEIEARQCTDLSSLRFAIVNSTRKLAPFEQALLVELSPLSQWRTTAASNVVKVDRNADLVQHVEAWLNHPDQATVIARGEPRMSDVAEEARAWGLTGAFAHPHALWLPIKDRQGRVLAGLVALRSEAWKPQHATLLIPLAGAYGHAWAALAPQSDTALHRVRGRVTKARVAIAVSVAALLGAFVPVPMSTLAPAEIVAAQPALVTAPIDGVIADVLVAPGAWVEKGTPIVRFVDVKLRSDAELARRNKNVAEARHFKVMQSAISTQKDMADLATTKAELDVAVAELAYAEEMLRRAEIRAERSGLLIYSAKSDWLGKPVATGERLMEIGDPARTEIKIELPVSDAIVLQAGSRVSLFLDGDPLRAIAGSIERTSYRPTPTAEQQLAFRLHAKLTDGEQRRIGSRGVARVDGESVSLWLYLLRRPISAVRQRLGL